MSRALRQPIRAGGRGENVKATVKGLLSRRAGRAARRKAQEAESGPLITDDVPEAELDVHETEGFMLLSRAINMADHLGFRATYRLAALRGMERMSDSDPERMRAIIREAGSFGETSLKRAINELAPVGKAHI